MHNFSPTQLIHISKKFNLAFEQVNLFNLNKKTELYSLLITHKIFIDTMHIYQIKKLNFLPIRKIQQLGNLDSIFLKYKLKLK